MTNLLIAASGTGGHLFPAIAVAEELPNSWQISWLGVPDRLETNLVPDKYQLTTIQVGGLQGSKITKIKQLLSLLISTLQVKRLIRKKNIEVVFTTGGYIAVPAILGAIWTRVPVLIHESNAMPGRATRLLGRFCKAVALGSPTAAKKINNATTIVTGTPVRRSFITPQPLPSWVPSGEGPLLVIFGGSQGAIGINKMVQSIIPSLLELGCRIVHITGDNKSSKKAFIHHNLVEKEFTKEVAGLLQNADLAISRAGASSLSELAICGTPTILIPFPYAKDNHQEENAICAAATGGAVIIHEHEPSHKNLKNVLLRLLTPRLKNSNAQLNPLISMREGMLMFAISNADKNVINLLNKIK